MGFYITLYSMLWGLHCQVTRGDVADAILTLIFQVSMMFFFNIFSVIGIATDYGLDDRGVRVRIPVGARIFSTLSIPALGLTQPPIQWVPGAVSPGVKRQGCEADHSPLTSAEVMLCIYTSTPPYAFMT
jgi:hypothetical protein